MIRRFTSAQFVPANAGAKAKNPVGSPLFSTPMVALLRHPGHKILRTCCRESARKRLKRRVEVVILVPADPETHVRAARRNPERKPLFHQVAALGRYERFALVGIAANNATGGRNNIYVHGKIMLIDDAWATIGSCNLHANSLFGSTEM